MEDAVKQTTERILEIIRDTELYRAYVFHRKRLMKQPALYEELRQFRREAHELKNAPEAELMDRTDAFREKYATFLENPLVDDFLSAEMSLVRAVQKISVNVINALDIGETAAENMSGENQ